MKNSIELPLAVLLIAVAFPAFGQVKNSTACNDIGELAGSIMYARQSGVAMGVMMEKANEGGDLADLSSSLVIAAYEETRWNGEPAKQSAVADFRDKYTLMCYKGQIEAHLE